jgi:hypothetical protein
MDNGAKGYIQAIEAKNKTLKDEVRRLEGVVDNVIKENYTLTCMNDSLNSSNSKAVEGLERAVKKYKYHNATAPDMFRYARETLKQIKESENE